MTDGWKSYMIRLLLITDVAVSRLICLNWPWIVKILKVRFRCGCILFLYFLDSTQLRNSEANVMINNFVVVVVFVVFNNSKGSGMFRNSARYSTDVRVAAIYCSPPPPPPSSPLGARWCLRLSKILIFFVWPLRVWPPDSGRGYLFTCIATTVAVHSAKSLLSSDTSQSETLILLLPTRPSVVVCKTLNSSSRCTAVYLCYCLSSTRWREYRKHNYVY